MSLSVTQNAIVAGKVDAVFEEVKERLDGFTIEEKDAALRKLVARLIIFRLEEGRRR